ncbi:MAG: dihydrolipoyl dehydrogenase [Chloroflexota bacterium]|nr:dihydrolipoyl dehydrogenase [Chloroflexota bacterium]
MVDVAVIGAGSGGYVAALRAAQLGAQVALIERDQLGGVCLNQGCIPSKALLRSVEVYQLARKAARFGVRASGMTLDWEAAQARKSRVVQGLRGGVGRLLDRAGVEVIRGEARFVSPDTVVVGRDRIEARYFIIATGSHPARPPIPGLDLPGVLDSQQALELEELPQSICIIGGGAIGVEFATLFAGAGLKVTLVEMLPRLLPLLDHSLGQGLQRSLEWRRVEVLTGTRVTGIEAVDGQLQITMTTESDERQVRAERALCAVGRRPNVEGFGLDAAGVRYNGSGIAVDERMRTNVPTVYAIGDVAQGRWQLAHVASHEGIVAAENVCGQDARMRYHAVPACVFSSPEVASVGLSEEEAREQGYDVQVGAFDLSGNGKALAYGQPEGFVKVVAEGEVGQVLGVHAVGPHVSELISEGAMAITLEATLEEFASTIHPHPTVSEALAEAALAVEGRAIHSSRHLLLHR